jgi:hypothetical protein
MDMSFILWVAMGSIACVLVAGLFPTVTVVVKQRRSRKTHPVRGKG